MKRIAIIGGGIAGLTAAYELALQARDGAAVEATLFEASPRLGGIVETVRRDGFLIECGPDGWVTEKPWARQLAEELGLANDLLPSNDATRVTYILKEGKLVAMPNGMRMMVPTDLDAVSQSSLFSPQALQSFHNEVLRAAELRSSSPSQDESVASFVRRHFGDEVLNTVGAPLLSGVFGGDVNTLSVHAVMAPFVAMEREHGSLITALKARTHRNSGSVFTTLRNGCSSLVDAMAAIIPPAWIRLRTPVSALRRTQNGWAIRSAQQEESFDALLMAAPVHIARTLLEPTDPLVASLMRMEASSAIVIAFGFNQSLALPPGFGFLVPPSQDDAASLLAATFVDQKFDARAPEGHHLLRAFFGGLAGAKLQAAENKTLAALALQQLAAILGPLPAPATVVLRRWPHSLPQYSVDHLERMAQLELRTQALGNLWLLGNGYRGVGLPDLIRDSRNAARACLS